MYKEFILQLCIFAKAIRNLAKLFTNLSYITNKITRNSKCSSITLHKTNPDYDLLIKRFHLYYDMKLVTFGIDRDQTLIIQFSVFIHNICSSC